MHKTSAKHKSLLIMLGIFLSLVLLEIILRICGFALLSFQEHRNRSTLEKHNKYRILCLGESTTEMGDNNAYPQQLENILNEKQIETTFSVINKGIPATNTTTILSKLEENLNKYNPNLVITMMGVNDYGDTPRQIFLPNKTKTYFYESLRVFKLFKLLFMRAFQNFSFFKSQTENSPFNRSSKCIQNEEYFLKLADYYVFQGNPDKAIKILLKAIELYPDSVQAYSELGWYYVNQGKHNIAEKMLKKAIDLDPKTDEAYAILGRHYRNTKNFQDAEKLLLTAIKMNIDNIEIYNELAKCYWDQKKYSNTEEVLLETIKIAPDEADAYGLLAVSYLEQNKDNIAEIYFKKSKELRSKTLNKTTKMNYNKLQEIVIKRGIKLVCIQYPLRNINNLKLLFDNRDGIIFIDNEKIFKDAIANSSYWDYFRDLFATDFGHCTMKGNRLLAENIANVLLEEVFNIK